MSFSMELKNELSSIIQNRCCEKAMLKGALQVNSSLALNSDGLSIEFRTKNISVANKICLLAKDLYKVDALVLAKKETKLYKEDTYIVMINDKDKKIVDDLDLALSRIITRTKLNIELPKECCQKAYLKGAFLAGGSINNPETFSYHLQIQVFNEEIALSIIELMNEYDLNARYTKNKKGFIVYLKDSEKISDFLRIMGSLNCLFTFEDYRIERDLNNSINRIINCEVANHAKAIEAAQRQLKDIEIVSKYYSDHLKKTLKEAIDLRLNNPEGTLQELSEDSLDLIGKEISKSALNHRFRIIKELANNISNEKETNK